MRYIVSVLKGSVTVRENWVSVLILIFMCQ